MPTVRLTVAATLLCAACASGKTAPSTPTSASTTAAAPTRSRNLNVLTEAELKQALGNSTAYDLVSTLRPRWLQARSADSFQKPTQVQVYLGNAHLSGGVESLRDIPALGIVRIEWIDGISAAGRWGLDHGAGAIVVTSAGSRPSTP